MLWGTVCSLYEMSEFTDHAIRPTIVIENTEFLNKFNFVHFAFMYDFRSKKSPYLFSLLCQSIAEMNILRNKRNVFNHLFTIRSVETVWKPKTILHFKINTKGKS